MLPVPPSPYRGAEGATGKNTVIVLDPKALPPDGALEPNELPVVAGLLPNIPPIIINLTYKSSKY